VLNKRGRILAHTRGGGYPTNGSRLQEAWGSGCLFPFRGDVKGGCVGKLEKSVRKTSPRNRKGELKGKIQT